MIDCFIEFVIKSMIENLSLKLITNKFQVLIELKPVCKFNVIVFVAQKKLISGTHFELCQFSEQVFKYNSINHTSHPELFQTIRENFIFIIKK